VSKEEHHPQGASPSKSITFKKHQLKTDKGETWIEKDSKSEQTAKIKIPDDIECDRCTLSLRWDGKWESVIFASCADIAIKKSGPSPPPPPAPAPAHFEKHDKAYCGVTGTDAERVSDKSGLTQTDCEKQCNGDSKCSCYDHKGDKDHCRLYHGHPKVVSSTGGYTAYTRESFATPSDGGSGVVV